MFRWLRRRSEKPVKLAEPTPDVDQIAELTRILEEAGEPVGPEKPRPKGFSERGRRRSKRLRPF